MLAFADWDWFHSEGRVIPIFILDPCRKRTTKIILCAAGSVVGTALQMIL